MKLLKTHVTSTAKTDDQLSGMLSVLYRFNIVGFKNKKHKNKLMDYLKKSDIAFEENGGFLLWLPTVEAGVRKVLLNHKMQV